MFDRLNFKQRALLAAVAVVIIFLQLYKLNEYGVEGSGWILSFLVAGLLLLPILSGVDFKKSTTKKGGTPNGLNAATLHIHREKNQWAIKEIRNRVPQLEDLLREWMDFKTVEECLGKRFDDIFFEPSYLFLFMIASLNEGSLDVSFFQSERFYVLRLQVAELMIEENVKMLKEMMPDKEPKKDLITKHVVNKLGEATKAIDEYIDAVLVKSEEPEAPIIDCMLKSLNLDTVADTERIKRKTRENFRVYIRNTMRELRAMRLLNKPL